MSVTQGGSRFAGLPWAIIISSLQDFGLARSARTMGECKSLTPTHDVNRDSATESASGGGRWRFRPFHGFLIRFLSSAKALSISAISLARSGSDTSFTGRSKVACHWPDCKSSAA